VSSASPYVITPEERNSYLQLFARADEDHDGYITGDQAR
jgi:Ca2+-binding EF-hand superfamily protein